MFVGSTNIDKDKLRRIFKDPSLVKAYSDSLIPEEFRHIRELQDNQLYIVAMTIRRIGLNDYKAMEKSINQLLKGVRITGFTQSLVEISFVYNLVNNDKVNLYLERL